MLLTFLRHLTVKLDEESPGWEAETVILLDGARYHTGEEIREYLRKMQQRYVGDPTVWTNMDAASQIVSMGTPKYKSQVEPKDSATGSYQVTVEAP